MHRSIIIIYKPIKNIMKNNERVGAGDEANDEFDAASEFAPWDE